MVVLRQGLDVGGGGQPMAAPAALTLSAALGEHTLGVTRIRGSHAADAGSNSNKTAARRGVPGSPIVGAVASTRGAVLAVGGPARLGGRRTRQHRFGAIRTMRSSMRSRWGVLEVTESLTYVEHVTRRAGASPYVAAPVKANALPPRPPPPRGLQPKRPGLPPGKAVQVEHMRLIPALKAFVFQLLESTSLSIHWFQI